MKIELGRRFWIVATVAFVVFTGFLAGRNFIHIMKTKSRIADLEHSYEEFRTRIIQDSTLLEHLHYDDYLEEYAREHFFMQRRDEQVYIIQE